MRFYREVIGRFIVKSYYENFLEIKSRLEDKGFEKKSFYKEGGSLLSVYILRMFRSGTLFQYYSLLNFIKG